jgi:hypothetical protein
MQDAALHDMLAIFDVLRVGDAGERLLAAGRLRELIGAGSAQ